MKEFIRFELVRIGLTLICVLSAITAHTQKLYQVSLQDFKIDTKDISFTVSEILDARRDKNSIGIIQAGLNNKPYFAVFEKPGLEEIEELLKSSGLYSLNNGLTLRINALKISENQTFFKETAKAELSVDFFIRYEALYYYVTTIFTSAEPKGVDATKIHDDNIVAVVEKALVMFSGQKNEPKPDRSFTAEELLDVALTLRDPLSMPIMTGKKFNDGYYSSFEEFINNAPSIDIDCKIKFSSPVSTICGDEAVEVPTLYGFANNNKLYILYHHQFFELEKRKDTFYFNGPTKMSKGLTNNLTEAYFGATAFTGTSIEPRNSYSAVYMLDMETGAVRSITGF